MTNSKATSRRTISARGMFVILVVIAALSVFDFADHFRALGSSKDLSPTRTPDELIFHEPPEPDEEVVERCIQTLEEILAKQRPVPEICGQYDDDELRQCGASMELLQRGPAAAAAIPVLVRTLKSINPEPAGIVGSFGHWRFDGPGWARQALVSIGKASLPALRKALHDEDALTRVHAARALSELGDNAADVLPVLLATLLDDQAIERDTNVRIDVSAALIEFALKYLDG